MNGLVPAPAPLPEAFPFGPRFFLEHLARFVRDRCPLDSEHLPAVHVHLVSAEVLDVCHVMGLTAQWVALAVFDRGAGGRHVMRTELVPYATITRVTIRAMPAEDGRIGFDLSRGIDMYDPSESSAPPAPNP